MELVAENGRPELFFGLVGAIGTDLGMVRDRLEQALANVGYEVEPIHVIELLHEIDEWANLDETPYEDRAEQHMTAGNEFREALGRGDALALLSIAHIQKNLREGREDPNEDTAYILKSLKHPGEVKTLRRVYGSSFSLISAYCPREIRIHDLATKIARSHQKGQAEDYRADAERLSNRDSEEPETDLGQRLRKTFPLGDIFVDASKPEEVREELKRFAQLLFGYPFHTPTKKEFGMFHASGAALRSAALPRQVGAAIADESGEILAVGTNEVPKAGGGQYWSDDHRDNRDYVIGEDSSEKMRQTILSEVLNKLGEEGWLEDEFAELDPPELLGEALPIMERTQVMHLNEFGRDVHAEMAAILTAARRGIPISGTRLFTTTFPCHNCTRHLIAAGVDQVFYIEPYPKSFARELHLDEIQVDGQQEETDLVDFRAFVGIAPRRFMEFFTMPKRKNDLGEVVEWRPAEASPRFTKATPDYLRTETEVLNHLKQEFEIVAEDGDEE